MEKKRQSMFKIADSRYKALSSNVILGIDNLGLLQFEISPSNEINIGAENFVAVTKSQNRRGIS